MSVIVTDTGFGPDNWAGGFAPFTANETANHPDVGLDLASDADVEKLREDVSRYAMIRVDFPGFSDGRGFTIARRLRLMRYRGRLRARGHVIADQYAMARRSGFDEIEIAEDLAARQPEKQWLFRADWQSHDYQARLRRGDYARLG